MRNIDAGLRFLHNRAAPPPAAMDYKGQELSEALYQYIIFAAMVRPSAGVGSAGCDRCVLRVCRRACKAARLTRASAPPCAPTYPSRRMRAYALARPLHVSPQLAALVAGYVKASYQLMLMVFAAGVVLAGVVCVPDWAYFNRNPVRWLPSRKAEREGPAAGKGGAKGKGKRGAKGKARRD